MPGPKGLPSTGLGAWILFLLLAPGCGTPQEGSPSVRVSEAVLFGNLECFRIETPSATYLYGKKGGGFASILDPDGHDWISYRPEGKAAGEYRGLPKCGQPVKYFHCGYGYGQYRNDNPFLSRVTVRQADHAAIVSETADGKSSCRWDFFPSHATLTLERIALPAYWFLYEGTPGGQLDADQDTVLRPGGKRSSLAEPWEDEIAWASIESPRSPYALLLVSHEPGARAASYVAWPYRPEADGSYRQMTVLGWGRPGWKDAHQHEPQLRALPARFTVSIVRNLDEPGLAKMAEGVKRAPER